MPVRPRKPVCRHAAQPRRAARRAGAADEPLRQHAGDRRGDQVRLDAHVEQARQRARGVVRVERREHQVAGERGLERDLDRLAVADLADQDDVGVLAQDRAQARPRT